MGNLVERIVMTAMNGFLPSAARVRRSVVGYGIVFVLLLTAYIAAVAGGSIYLAQEAGAVAAAFLVAIAALAAAVMALAVMAYLDRRARIEALLMQRRAATMSNELLGTLAPQLPMMVRDSPVATAVMVASLSYALARSWGIGRRRL